jgi:hypothetical protein
MSQSIGAPTIVPGWKICAHIMTPAAQLNAPRSGAPT